MNLYPLFHLKVSKISFSNWRLFPHTDYPLLQETLSELVEHRLGISIGRHVELHPPVRGAAVVIYHTAEVLAGAEDMVMSCVVDWMLRSVRWCMPSCPSSPLNFYVASIFFSLDAHQSYIPFSLHSFSFTFTILLFFIQIQNFENKRISIEVFEILRI